MYPMHQKKVKPVSNNAPMYPVWILTQDGAPVRQVGAWADAEEALVHTARIMKKMGCPALSARNQGGSLWGLLVFDPTHSFPVAMLIEGSVLTDLDGRPSTEPTGVVATTPLISE
jgi:hypothetical protein